MNISGESSKSGVSSGEVLALAAEIMRLPSLRLRGLMAIPAAGGEAELLHSVFKAMHQCWLTLQQEYHTIDTLSLGMSDDFEEAVAQGANMVRIGRAIFGERS